MRALPVARPLRSLTGPDVRQQVIPRWLAPTGNPEVAPGRRFPGVRRYVDAAASGEVRPAEAGGGRRRPTETDGDRRSHLADRSGQIGLAAERRLSLPSEQPECCSLAGHSPVWTRQNRSVL